MGLCLAAAWAPKSGRAALKVGACVRTPRLRPPSRLVALLREDSPLGHEQRHSIAYFLASSAESGINAI